MALWTMAAGALSLAPLACDAARAAEPTTIALLDLDYSDTSGEPTNQKADHERRLRDFMESLRRDLENSGMYRVVALDCDNVPCSVKGLTPEELFEAARGAGARLLLFGGVHKMSTLVQWARVQVVDVERNVVLQDRHLSFRGDNDVSWKRAEAFLAGQLKEQSAR